MIQCRTKLKVADNSGAKVVQCISLVGGYKQRYVLQNNCILISVKKLRTKRRAASKVLKGEIHKALLIRTKVGVKAFSGDKLMFLENVIVLLNKQNKLIGTRIFGLVPKSLRYTKYLKLLFLAAGVVS